LGLGKELYIKYANLNEPYSDLDEVFARFVDPMNDYVSLMISHRNFREGSPEEVEAYLHHQIKERPQNIPYCLRFEPSFAGCFVLTWIKNPNSKDPIKKSRIQVMPNGYYMEKRYFSRPGEIIQYLKKHTEKTANRPISTANEGGGDRDLDEQDLYPHYFHVKRFIIQFIDEGQLLSRILDESTIHGVF
jgi:hypothetical protein